MSGEARLEARHQAWCVVGDFALDDLDQALDILRVVSMESRQGITFPGCLDNHGVVDDAIFRQNALPGADDLLYQRRGGNKYEMLWFHRQGSFQVGQARTLVCGRTSWHSRSLTVSGSASSVWMSRNTTSPG